MKAVCQMIGLLVLAILTLTLLGLATFIGLGALLTRWLPLSLFQASALALGAAAAVALVFQTFASMMHLQMDHRDDDDDDFGWTPDDEPDGTPVFAEPPPAKIGRNAPCPCGSGKKYKNCCGRSAAT